MIVAIVFSFVAALLGTGLFAIAARREVRKQIKKQWSYRLCGLALWAISLPALGVVLPSTQAIFAWLGLLSLGATVMVL
ncbi:MAG: hypothetical protein JKY66_06145 [Spongiibacteraceae bacterium]|nr:hypothetical protein [Spongiibacteraceae bacterium]